MPTESMPLAAGYLKANALADPDVRAGADVQVFNFGGGVGPVAMCQRLFADGVPDVLACSVLGWNFRALSAVAETFKQLNPSGWVVFGGTHVAHQGRRLLPQHRYLDVVVNGEGEFIFRDLLRAHLAGVSRTALHLVAGVSFRDAAGATVTTADPDPIADLSVLASPLLDGAIPLTDRHGRFRYDVALMETNRGCPYHCAFCYWGGAVGQKVRQLPRQRLRDELDLLARHRVRTIVLCDANFGMLPADLEFVEDVIRVKQRYGYPQALETSWAKNKSTVFYEIVRTLRAHELHSSFTLALQTMDEVALEGMHRRNMRLNAWEDLARWLRVAGLDAYAELIWGAPGETYESFLAGYDRLAALVPRIAVYPLIVLPNTEYAARRDELGLVTVRGDVDDYEYVVATPDITLEDNRRMQRFVLWARAIVENLVLRHVWRPLRELAGLTQSQVLLSLSNWIARRADSAAARLDPGDDATIGQPGAVLSLLHRIYAEPRFDVLLSRWWHEEIEPRVPSAAWPFLADVLAYDLATRAVYRPGPDLETVTVAGDAHWVRRGVRFGHDVPAGLAALAGGAGIPKPAPWTVDLWFRAGLDAHLDNHELAAQFVGTPAAPGAVPVAARAGVPA